MRNLPKIIRHTVYFFKAPKRGVEKRYYFRPRSGERWTAGDDRFKNFEKKFLIRIAGDYAWEQAAQRFGVTDGIEEFQDKSTD